MMQMLPKCARDAVTNSNIYNACMCSVYRRLVINCDCSKTIATEVQMRYATVVFDVYVSSAMMNSSDLTPLCLEYFIQTGRWYAIAVRRTRSQKRT
jgi:hypothetical protein